MSDVLEGCSRSDQSPFIQGKTKTPWKHDDHGKCVGWVDRSLCTSNQRRRRSHHFFSLDGTFILLLMSTMNVKSVAETETRRAVEKAEQEYDNAFNFNTIPEEDHLAKEFQVLRFGKRFLMSHIRDAWFWLRRSSNMKLSVTKISKDLSERN